MFRTEENGQFRGTVTFLDAKLNDGCIEDKHVAAGAAISASKLEHQHRAVYAQESATTAAAETLVAHVVKGTNGTLKTFKAGCVTACVGDATITVDLKVNGVSVLTAVVTLDNGQSARELVAGTIDTDSLSADDVIEVAVTVNAGTGMLGKGVFAYVDVHEDVN